MPSEDTIIREDGHDEDERLRVFNAAQELLDAADSNPDYQMKLRQAASSLLLALVEDAGGSAAIRGAARLVLVRTLLRHSYDVEVADELLRNAAPAPEGSKQWLELRLLEMECCVCRRDAKGATEIWHKLDAWMNDNDAVWAASAFLMLQLGPLSSEMVDSLILRAAEPLRSAAKIAAGRSDFDRNSLGIGSQFHSAACQLSGGLPSDLNDPQGPSPVTAEAWGYTWSLIWPSQAYMEASWNVFQALDKYVTGEQPNMDAITDSAPPPLLFLSVLLHHRAGQKMMRDNSLKALRKQIVPQGDPMVDFCDAIIAHDAGEPAQAAAAYEAAAIAPDLRHAALIGLYCVKRDGAILKELKQLEDGRPDSMETASWGIVKALAFDDSVVGSHIVHTWETPGKVLPLHLDLLRRLVAARLASHLPLQERLDDARQAYSKLDAAYRPLASTIMQDLTG